MREKITIPVGDIRLEGILVRKSTSKSGIVTHPHPLYGGSMYNKVVQAAMGALNQAAWTGLCFNFRGVEDSLGKYDNGIGEQEDLLAAVQFLAEQDIKPPVVIGYSFGAWVAARAWPRLTLIGVSQLVMIAPPVAMMNFNDVPNETAVSLIICGQKDQIGPPDQVLNFGRGLKQPVEPVIIEGTDHFFNGREAELRDIIVSHLK
ncbi:MAG: alpha/beta fold hydrolase [Deltaproteobacteria bacterium]|nr:alpha/beta fold hydrolase [Deltaproteobacteria bacterium]